MKTRWLFALCVMVVVTSIIRADEKPGTGKSKADRTITFAEGKWDREKWTPLRLPEQQSARAFTQKPDCIGTTTFAKEEKKKHLDNVLLMTDSGTTEGEFAVTFRIGEERGTAPGFFLSPTCKDGVLETAIVVFVADYTMAVWRAETDPDAGKTKYVHLVRTATWQDPAVKHVLRCRYSKKRKSVALRLDQRDVLVLRFPDYEINSRIGIWGCHGTCDYYSVTMAEGGTLEWSGRPPEEKK